MKLAQLWRILQRAAADGADVAHALGQGVEDGAGPIEDGGLAADHYEEVARLRAFRPAAHRGVEHVDVARLECFMDAAHEQRGVRGVVDVEGAGPDALEDPLRAQEDLLHFDRPGETRGYDLAGGGEGGGGVGPPRAGGEQGGRVLAADVVHGELVAGA